MGDNKIDDYQICNLADLEDNKDKSFADASMSDKSRKSFRLPVKDIPPPPVKAMIDGIFYEVIDMGSRGLGLAVDGPGVFTVGKKYSITFFLQDQEVLLHGQVVHVSRDISENYICGIELTDMDEESEHKMQTFLLEQRGDIFSGK